MHLEKKSIDAQYPFAFLFGIFIGQFAVTRIIGHDIQSILHHTLCKVK